MGTKELRQSPMMGHLIDSLDQGQSIGHYGRLVFAMVARHFLHREELIGYLRKDPACSQEQAEALCLQIEEHDYSPPHRERILEWQALQEFPICPNSQDPDSCNIYRELHFPEDVYRHISGYYEKKAEGG
jgi:hypothetical protein